MAFPKREPTVPTTIRVSQSVYYEARALLADPRTGRIKLDTWGPLVTRLLRRWVDEQKIAPVDGQLISTVSSPLCDGGNHQRHCARNGGNFTCNSCIDDNKDTA